MMKQKTPRCKVIPWHSGLDIVIWTCPVCGYRFYEFAGSLDHDVHCSLCGRMVWPGAADFQMED